MKTRTILYSNILLLAGLALQAQNAYTPQRSAVDAREFIPPLPNNALVQPSIVVNNNRDAYFLHGLGGTVKSWNITALRLKNDYKLFTHVPEYEDHVNGTLNLAADAVYAKTKNIDSSHSATSKAIMIGHSQGGLVAKTMDYLHLTFPDPTVYPQKFGGIVTFGTPHGGAMILNNGDPQGSAKLIQAFVQDGCVKMGRAEITNLVQNNWKLRVLTGFLNLDDVLQETIPEAACGTFANTLIPLLMDDLASSITTDYNVGSPMVDTLNSYATNIPVVAFYGEEEEPVFFRTLSSFTLGSREVDDRDPYTGGDDDSEHVQTANQMMAHYLAEKDYQLWKYSRAWGFKARRRRIKAAIFNFQAYKWLHDANNRWKEIIGAARDSIEVLPPGTECAYYKNLHTSVSGGAGVFTNTSATHPQVLTYPSNGLLYPVSLYKFRNWTIPNSNWLYEHYDYYPSVAASGPVLGTLYEPSAGAGPLTESMYRRCNQYYRVRIHRIEKPNDGVVTAESATAYPAAVARVKMERTNHQQMRNCTETKKAFEDLFGGDIQNTVFFHTDKR